MCLREGGREEGKEKKWGGSRKWEGRRGRRDVGGDGDVRGGGDNGWWKSSFSLPLSLFLSLYDPILLSFSPLCISHTINLVSFCSLRLCSV